MTGMICIEVNVRVFVYEYLSGGGVARAGEAASLDTAGAPDATVLELLAAGLSMRNALVADLSAMSEVSVTYACGDVAHRIDAPGQPVSARQPDALESAVDFVRRGAAQHDVAWIVAPETDGLLSQLAAVVEPGRWIGCTPTALHLCSRKRATLARLAAHGLTTPLAFDAEATQWIVKPDDGAGCLDTRRHATRATAQTDLQARRVRGEPATLEPWVEGDALSLSLLCSGQCASADAGVELLGINRQHIALSRDGSLHDHGVEIGPVWAAAATEPEGSAQQASANEHPQAVALRAVAQAVVRAVPGLRGFVGIDVVWHAQRGPVVIEVNPRVTCAYVGLSALLGRNLAAEVLAVHDKDRSPSTSSQREPREAVDAAR